MGITRRTFLGAAAVAGLAACSPNPAPNDATGGQTTLDPASGGTTTSSSSPPSPASTASALTTTAPSATSAATAAATTSATTSTWQPGQPAAFVKSGSRQRAQVALTFHANGDVGLATRMLDLLKQRATPVTVFAVGNWLVANPALGKRITADGHELANHTWSHQEMRPLAASVVADEIKRAATAITTLTGSQGKWFRPSGIEIPTDRILAEAGKAGYPVSVGYDLDSLDFTDPGGPAVIANVKAAVQNGSIVSLHFGHANTLDALPAILDHLSAKGLQPVTVSELLG
jgi:peptidoglycan/xylan/chitin deacetylase (PgdA/CDA1 family)